MLIAINDQQNLLQRAAVMRADEQASASFRKFRDHVFSVEITVEDINGPKGGVDKQCRVLVKLRGHNDILTTANDSSLSKAVKLAISRAATSVNRGLGRRRSIRNTTPPKLGLNV